MGRILTVEQAAEKLQVRPKTVRAWLRSGKIPGRKIGRVYRLMEDQLEAFVALGTPQDESLAFETPTGMRLVPPAPGQRKSARGIAAHIPGSVEDFMREKHEEIEREEREWQERYGT
jgi:excisionase family DNA binding protein